MEVFPNIVMDPDIRFGKPCIKGTRLDVATVVGYVAAGENFDTIQREFQVNRDQILSALRYAAYVADHLPPAVKAA